MSKHHHDHHDHSGHQKDQTPSSVPTTAGRGPTETAESERRKSGHAQPADAAMQSHSQDQGQSHSQDQSHGLKQAQGQSHNQTQVQSQNHGQDQHQGHNQNQGQSPNQGQVESRGDGQSHQSGKKGQSQSGGHDAGNAMHIGGDSDARHAAGTATNPASSHPQVRKQQPQGTKPLPGAKRA